MQMSTRGSVNSLTQHVANIWRNKACLTFSSSVVTVCIAIQRQSPFLGKICVCVFCESQNRELLPYAALVDWSFRWRHFVVSDEEM
jgi:hypothetical protein